MDLKRSYLFCSNAALVILWVRVLWKVGTVISRKEAGDQEEDWCHANIFETLKPALGASFVLEVFHAAVGLTRSKILPVLLFAVIRPSVEYAVTPMIGCLAAVHLWTVACWSFGDTVRFACFATLELANNDAASPVTTTAKWIRYTVGPIMFPLGAAGEMGMVAYAAYDGRPYLWIAAALWPLGFYPLYVQLLKQRRKFVSGLSSSTPERTTTTASGAKIKAV